MGTCRSYTPATNQLGMAAVLNNEWGEFLFLGICCVILIIVYRILARSVTNATRDADNSRSMLQLTNTNNSHNPLGDILTSLDGDLAKLDLTLHADMKGYMDGE